MMSLNKRLKRGAHVMLELLGAGAALMTDEDGVTWLYLPDGEQHRVNDELIDYMIAQDMLEPQAADKLH